MDEIKKSRGKWWLTAIVACCLAPGTFADRDRCNPHDKNCQHQQQIPEGGSAAMYLVGAGLTCLGAILYRSRLGKPTQS